MPREEPPLPAGITLRTAGPGDERFLRELYRSIREPELALTAWDDAQKDAFANQQFDFQDRWYRSNYPGARLDVIVREGAPIGRLYLYETAVELRVMDIALVPRARNAGLGTQLIEWVKARAARAGAAVTLHVETFNPARALYARLGFREEAVDGVNVRLRWEPRS